MGSEMCMGDDEHSVADMRLFLRERDGTIAELRRQLAEEKNAREKAETDLAGTRAKNAKLTRWLSPYLFSNTRQMLRQRRRLSDLPNWSIASQMFGVGSGSGWEICRICGVDPNAKDSRAQETTDANA